MADSNEWATVYDNVVRSTATSSNIDVILDPTPICSNMSNKEFRETIARDRDIAVTLIQNRLKAFTRWDQAEQARVMKWFGSSSSDVRTALSAGLPRLLDVMRNLKPENVIRWDEQKQRNITCTIVPDNGSTDAAVCKPDSAKRIIAIYPHFCTSPDALLWKGCKVFTLIHECTHYTDVFDSNDEMYGVSIGLSFWAKSNPEKAIRNADSITCYVGFEG
ncbi:M35 family metallo-endopeptidase [Paraburkholderia tropica]|uniref:M35 family metallo-endopeptidase n=1 Tax=Paraburkholderia tropica TaxID=92647 RepID=UPI002AB63630|nr:M35 family metallo-endopeptidase [Paraburkholderia tropica]